MRRVLRRGVVALVVLAALVATAGWIYARPTRSASLAVPVSGVVLPDDSVVWAQGRTIHVGARSVRVPQRVDSMALTGHGVFFVTGTRVRFTDLRSVRDTPYAATQDLTASRDGRYLALTDFDHGPRGRYGVRRAAVVVLDAATGHVVLRDASGMGSLVSDDLADLYEDAEPHVDGFHDGALYATAADGVLRRYPLDGSSPLDLGSPASFSTDDAEGRLVGTRLRGGRVRVYPSLAQGDAARLSPSGRTVLAQDSEGRDRLYDVRTGRRTTPALTGQRTVIGRWTGPDTFYAVGYGGEDPVTGIVSCTSGQARCRTVVPALQLGGRGVVFATSDY